MSTMSDNEKDIDIESEEDDDELEEEEELQESYHSRSNQLRNSQLVSEAEKREHHNQLERKRRDQIKDNFSKLREAVKLLRNEKVASRAQILKKAAEYIRVMQDQNRKHLNEIADLKRQNSLLESQINILGDSKGRNMSDALKYEVKEEPTDESYDDEEINDTTSSESESDESESDPLQLLS